MPIWLSPAIPFLDRFVVQGLIIQQTTAKDALQPVILEHLPYLQRVQLSSSQYPKRDNQILFLQFVVRKPCL